MKRGADANGYGISSKRPAPTEPVYSSFIEQTYVDEGGGAYLPKHTDAHTPAILESHSSVNKSYPPLDEVSLLLQGQDKINALRKAVLEHAFPKDPFSVQKANQQRLPGPLPSAVGLRELGLIRKDPQCWWVTAKMDGMRFMMYITERGSYLIDREFRFRKLKEGDWYCRMFTGYDSVNRIGFETLLDGELIWEDSGNGMGSVSSLKFMVFDCLVYKGRNVVNEKLSARLHEIQSMAQICSANIIAREKTRLPMFAKRMSPAGEVQSLMEKLYMMPSRDGYTYRDDDSEDYVHREATCSFRTLADGLVFMLEDADYHFKPKNSLIKWKLSHTIDLMTLVESAKHSGEIPGMLTVSTYYFAGASQEKLSFAEVPVEHSLWVSLVAKARETNPTCEAVCVECAYVASTRSWIVERGRPEKTYPNGANTIRSTLKTIEEDISHEVLLRWLDYSQPPPAAVRNDVVEEKKQRPVPVALKPITRSEPAPIRAEPVLIQQHNTKPTRGTEQHKNSLDNVIEKIKDLIEEWKKAETWELEGRVKGRISKAMYEDVLVRLSSDKQLLNKTVTATRDLFYGDLRVTTGDKNEVIRKGRGQYVDIQIVDTQWALRIGLKNELFASKPSDLGMRAPELVRIKERTSFTYKSQGKACWAFDITRVRQGSESELKRQEDLARQNNRELEWVYELEVEAMRVDRLLLDSRTNIARSLVLKLLFYYLEIDHFKSPVELALRYSNIK